MTFIHSRLSPAPCCVCGVRPWTQLHHWGEDGGMGRKPSDLWLARVCQECAPRAEVKARALRRDGRWELLAAFAQDAVRCLAAWVEHRDAGSPPAAEGCTVDDLVRWLASPAADGPLPDRQRWLLQWADRRAAAVVDAALAEEVGT